MISKLARDPRQFQVGTFFFESAREGMAAYLASGALGDRSSGSIILPAFIGYSEREGSGVFDPVRASGLTPVFYEVNADLSADIDSLARVLASSPRGSVVVLIHYFGRTDPRTEDVRSVCETAGALLVEDLAHAFFSHANGSPAGRSGDAAIFSLHKMLPTPDGGMLITRGGPLTVSSTRPDHAATILRYDHVSIAARRRRTYELMEAGMRGLVMAGVPCQLLWDDIGPLDVPQTLPMLVPASVRDEFYRWMNHQGAGVVSLYHTLIPELPDGFDAARRLSRSITNLPVHQDMSDDDALAVVELVDAFFRGRVV